MNPIRLIIVIAGILLLASLTAKLLLDQKKQKLRDRADYLAEIVEKTAAIIDADESVTQELSFGYKTAWLAIPTEDTQKVIKTLKLTSVKECSWADGIKTSYERPKHVFISPPYNGWTFAVGMDIGSFNEDVTKNGEFLNFIKSTALSFDNFYYFGTHRIVEYQSWLKVKSGKITRAYAYLGERGETLFELGEKTPEEQELDMNFFDEKSPEASNSNYFERADLRYPDEEDVINLSKKWSISTFASEKFAKITQKGFIGLTK